jgi:hypothetical protein
MQRSLKNLLAGAIFVAFGLAFAIAAANYDLGSALKMGPGYIPLVLGGVLVLLGAIIVAEGLFAGASVPIGAVPWRGAILLAGGVVFFGATVRGLGLAPALFVAALMSAFASRRTGVVAALLMAVGLTVLCILIFVEGLGAPLRLFGPWLGF